MGCEDVCGSVGCTMGELWVVWEMSFMKNEQWRR